jgi:subtilisin family serine protease
MWATLSRWNVTRIRRAFPREFRSPALAAKFGLDRTFIIEVPEGTDAPVMAAAIRAFDAEVEAASYDAIGGVALIPDDPGFDMQWGMRNTGQTGGTVDADIDAPEAWDTHTGNYGTVTVAIIDSGCDPHAEFADRLVPGINTHPFNPPMLTTDDCHQGSLHGHGTHVAGIVGAKGNNGVGVAGMNWGIKIMPVRVLDGCNGPVSAAAEGIVWAVDHGADICNLSLQYYPPEHPVHLFADAVNYAHANGVLLVAAAGNNVGNEIAYPAILDNCMAVSATDHNDDLASFSNWGDELDVSAPGKSIYSTMKGDTYGLASGTSMASPHVAGLAALIKSYVPGLTHDEIRSIINDTVDDLGPPGWDDHFGYGRINASAAMLAADETTIRVVASAPPDGAIDARQPSEPNGDNPTGWQVVELTFDGDVSGLTADDFSVVTEGGAYTPQISDVKLTGYDTVAVFLDSFIPTVAWTTIRHDFSGTGARLGYLPGDANGDRTSAPADILAVVDALNGVADLEIWQTDVDRDGDTTEQDILRVIDLLNGMGGYDDYLDAMLPK